MVDRISDLPDSVLLHILSFLPALSVVRTSVLSRTWQHLWTCVPSLDFDYENFKDFKDGKSHVNFVNSFLLRYKAGSIQKFRINSIPDNSHDAEEWIKFAFDRNVEELDLRFPYYGYHLSLQLPQTIFGCKTLVALKLEGHLVSMAFPPKACLTSLKTLDLDLCKSPYPEFENNLVSCCAVLEKLSIRRRRYDSGRESFRVNSRKLKQLEIEFCSSSIPYQNDIGYVIDINAPGLEDLDIKDSGSCSLVLANVGALNKAKIRLNDSNALKSLLKSFSALKNVKSLSLSSGYTRQACNLDPGLTVQYMNLTHLTLGVNGVWVQLLPHFLHCFPSLEVLRLMKETLICSCINWNLCTDPELLPADLLPRLRVFEAEEIRETREELGMLNYILKNSKVLELVQIHNLQITERYIMYTSRKAREYEQKFQVLEEECRKIDLQIRLAEKIQSFPRASQKCQIKFS